MLERLAESALAWIRDHPTRESQQIEVLRAQHAEGISILLDRFDLIGGILVGQVEELRGGIADVSAAASRLASQVDSTAQRVLDRLAELGEPDPDLSADIESLRTLAAGLDTDTTKLEGVAATTVPAPEPPADTPPADEPPADVPPDEPPADTPPDVPPVDVPPVDEPPADTPPADVPPDSGDTGDTGVPDGGADGGFGSSTDDGGFGTDGGF